MSNSTLPKNTDVNLQHAFGLFQRLGHPIVDGVEYQEEVRQTWDVTPSREDPPLNAPDEPSE